MELNAPISILNRQRYSEGSSLAPFRDDRNTPQAWKKNQVVSKQGSASLDALQLMVTKLSRQRRKPLGGSAPQTVAIQDFQVVSDGGDWYNCYAFDGSTAATSAIVKVAKHQDLRCILPSASPAGGAWVSKLIRGITYTYTYTAVAATTLDGVNVSEYTRSVSGSDSSSETDYITPCLNCLNAGSSPIGAGDIITAFQASFAGPATLVGITWQALADGRAWASQP